MRYALALSVLLNVAAAVFFAFQSFAPASDISTSETTLPVAVEDVIPKLTGNTFALHYYPVNSNNPAAVNVAQMQNAHNFTVQFDTDSTFVRRSNKYITPGAWKQVGDSVYYSGNPFLLLEKAGALFLRDSVFLIELKPL